MVERRHVNPEVAGSNPALVNLSLFIHNLSKNLISSFSPFKQDNQIQYGNMANQLDDPHDFKVFNNKIRRALTLSDLFCCVLSSG